MTSARRMGRYTAFEMSGQAGYLQDSQEPAEWVRALVPGADAAREHWQAENAKGRALSRQWQVAGGELMEFRRLNPTTAELEAAERAYRALDQGVKRQSRAALKALEAYDDLVLDAYDAENFTASAAEIALARHREVEAAFSTLFSALDKRDAAWRASGSPGRDWRAATPNVRGELRRIEEFLGRAVSRFDVESTAAVADGGTAPEPGVLVLPDGRRMKRESDAPFAPWVESKAVSA